MPLPCCRHHRFTTPSVKHFLLRHATMSSDLSCYLSPSRLRNSPQDTNRLQLTLLRRLPGSGLDRHIAPCSPFSSVGVACQTKSKKTIGCRGRLPNLEALTRKPLLHIRVVLECATGWEPGVDCFHFVVPFCVRGAVPPYAGVLGACGRGNHCVHVFTVCSHFPYVRPKEWRELAMLACRARIR